MSNKTIIEVEDLTMAYSDQPVLWDNDVSIVENSKTAIIGPNGAGKSTFLKGILGLLPTLSGSAHFMGKAYKEVQAEIAYIPQSSEVNWDFPTTALDVVLMGRYVHLGWIKRPSQKDKKIAEQALAQIGMSEFKNRQISQLSGGQKQRVFIARAIAQDANIYIMDEPLAGVDKNTESIIMDFLNESQKQGKTSVVVHHDLNTLAEYFDHLVIINKRIVAQGKMTKVLTQENLENANMNGDYGLDVSV
ncbi:MAG: ABC transporter ATP-binding protein [Clostridiaceae bacterium]|nr:ABC transporter ATP-binding protein [Clostridiaceae bacterium]